ncbi:uncharacterized protein BXIN_2303 [Babesia sp. Xinjiang]|uniref:uncharacterized protein n=1 Tax=Babesia sp. Xinjiang TaxID=462227 RepID=UPI000A23A5B6|nr:uncharacterized protein BXIN_2303 [Babesia sp. Xinjiang]ORM40769.1 hypothetical protein BXIN_2303 [Babesia sp. Xinjiang]
MAKKGSNVVFVAIIGEQRELIVSRAFGRDDEAALQLSAYAAMDIVQEKMVIQHYSTKQGETSDPYLGFITPTLLGEEFLKVHAYTAATGFTIIAIFDEQEAPRNAIKQFFEKIHMLFSTTVCNPLMSMRFHYPQFISEIDRIAAAF